LSNTPNSKAILDHSHGVVFAEYPKIAGMLGLQIPIEGITEDQLRDDPEQTVETVDAAALPDGRFKQALKKLQVTSLLVVAVRGKTGLHGAFSVDAIGEERISSNSDRQFCAIFASQIAVAIENSRAAQRQAEDRLRLLAEAEHSLKTPLLHAIRRAQRSLEGDQPAREDVVVIRALCTRMYAQLSTLRVFSRLAAGEDVKADLVLLSASEIVTMVKKAVEDAEALERPDQHNRFVFDTEEQPNAAVDADINLIEIAVRNVLDNAVKYSYADTPIKVSIRMRHCVEISISNRGLAIRPNERNLIFKRGWRSSSAMAARGEGSGIGLWIVNPAMTVLNGSVSIEPADDVTVVKLRLPFSKHENSDR
jgi:signal transduction histidine kinase